MISILESLDLLLNFCNTTNIDYKVKVFDTQLVFNEKFWMHLEQAYKKGL